jgi:hypothetical protein
MQKSSTVIIAVSVAMLASGCSTRPRNFVASVSAPVASRTAFETDYRTCQTLVANGRTSDFKAGAAQVLATGAGAIGGGVAVVGLGVGGTISGAGMAAAAAMPVVGVLAGFGVSRAIRGGKERKFKRLMSSCLAEYGHQVESWDKLKKNEDPASIAASRARVLEPASVPATTTAAAETSPEQPTTLAPPS